MKLHYNHFDKIRILAALAVIFSHHYHLTGFILPSWLNNKWLQADMMGGVGVMTFFFVSGYLVTKSWMRAPNVGLFLRKRFLRIWPGLATSVVIGIIVGWYFTELDNSHYFTQESTWRFLITNISLLKEYSFIGGTFMTNPIKEVVNGVYWSLPLEFKCYVLLGIAGTAGIFKIKWLSTLFLFIYISWFLCLYNSDITGVISHEVHFIEYPAYFCMGALAGVHEKYWTKYAFRMLVYGLPIFVWMYFFAGFTSTARFFCLPLLVFCIGNMPAKPSTFSRAGDPSYGIYLYGYPVAQSVVALFPWLSFLASFVVTCMGALAIGYASWHYVERPALRWRWGSGSAA